MLGEMLCPAGNGVYMVSSGKSKTRALQQLIYNSYDTEVVYKTWHEKLMQQHAADLFLLGIPSDNGAGIMRGANWGPLFLRETLYKNCPQINKLHDLGDVRVIPHLLHDKYLNSETIKTCQKKLYNTNDTDLPISPLSIAERVCHIIHSDPNKKIFVLGGDHSVSYPLVKSYLENKSANNVKAAIVHFDAHTDLLSSRLGIDICFGSWAYQIIKYLQSPDLLVQVGIRASQYAKSHWEKKLGIKQFWAKELRESSAQTIATKVVEHLHNKGITEIYISFDIDVLDSALAGATGAPEGYGLTPEEVSEIITILRENFSVTGADIVEVAPYIGAHYANRGSAEPETTLNSALTVMQTLIESLLA